ncbi:hypothetical protein CUREO_1244 [Campylobacter ureolyticus RIGS 9880]|uniref:Uncharacterized protein n=1 Tax=Campylobacter ureolyticus RIGS 9880 TaxID=1032069 RepID=A0AAU8U181_9BACT|nr:hypothetical protein [Campylobacter ureolyticus]AKT91088.1 hypothetical protein CUREO_1244 [Campylobacter ureolyticus RIGS 9880]
MSILKELNQRPIAYYPLYAKLTGSTTAGILLSQLMYWFSKKDKVFKTDIEILEETMLTTNELRGAKLKLKKASFIKITREGTPARTFYQINWQEYEKALLSFSKEREKSTAKKTKNSVGKTPKLDCGNSRNLSSENHQTSLVKTTELDSWNSPNLISEIPETINKVTKITTEITTETTSENLLSALEKNSELDFSKSRDLKNKKNEVDLVLKPKATNVEIYEQSLKSFDLKYKTDFNTPGVSYKKRLKEFIDKKRIENPNYQSYEEFEISLLAKGYKYQNFAMAYLTWQSNNQKNGSSYKSNFQNGYQNSFKEETSPEMKKYLDRYLKRLNEPSPFNYYDTLMADYRAQQRNLNA